MMQSLKQWSKSDRGGPGSLAMQEDDTTRQRELAVIEAAKDYRRAQADSITGMHSGRPMQEAARNLCKAVDALTTQQPVDPQTLEPGTRFNFVLDDGETSGPCRVWQTENGPIRYQHLKHGPKWMLYSFSRGDRIIPLPEDTKGIDDD